MRVIKIFKPHLNMPRIALTLEYDGSRYHGWQRQSEADSVQARLEIALSRVADSPVNVVCAGRTDAGVHASHQVVHFDTEAVRPERAWLLGVTQVLPADISVLSAQAVDSAFHARFSATARSYRYIILNRVTRSALHRGRVTWWRRPLDEEAMHAAGQHLLGEHDFSSFRAKDCQSISPVRYVESLSIHRRGAFVYMDITANAFLHHMVRTIIGTLLPVGAGAQPVDAIKDILQSKRRLAAGVTAPPDGLYLVAVRYPDAFGIRQAESKPVFWSTNCEKSAGCC